MSADCKLASTVGTICKDDAWPSSRCRVAPPVRTISAGGLLRAESLCEDLYDLILAKAPQHELINIIQRLTTAIAFALEYEDSKIPKATKAPRPPKSSPRVAPVSERWARGVLRRAVSNIEASKDPAVFEQEARTLVPFVRDGRLDGVLAKKALLDVATHAGIDDAEAILLRIARSS